MAAQTSGSRRSRGTGDNYPPQRYEATSSAHAFAPVVARPGASYGLPDGASNQGGQKGGTARWGFLHPADGIGGVSASWGDGGGGYSMRDGLSSRMFGQSGKQSGLQHTQTDQSGNLLPVELPRQSIAGGHTTRDLGHLSQADVQQGVTADGMTRPFTEEVVSYKHGDNVILHQWAGGGDLLVNCQSPTPQSFICQYGIASGSMAWTLDVSRTCDKFWFGVTVDKDLDCNDWIADHDAAYMISEEGEIEEKTYENYVPKTTHERPARPAMVPQAEAAPRWVRLKPFPPAAQIQGLWASIAFVLDMDKGELYMQVRNGAGDTSPKSRLFRGLPRGFMVYPCLSMCNAGQVVFLKYGE